MYIYIMIYKNIRIRTDIYEHFRNYGKKQGIATKKATEMLMSYAMEQKLDLSNIGTDKSEQLGNKINALQNTYVSFQRTFEYESKLIDYTSLLLQYEIARFMLINGEPNKQKQTFKLQSLIKRFFIQLVKMHLILYPKQKKLVEWNGPIPFFTQNIEAHIPAYLEKLDISLENNNLLFQTIEYAKQVATLSIERAIKQK